MLEFLIPQLNMVSKCIIARSLKMQNLNHFRIVTTLLEMHNLFQFKIDTTQFEINNLCWPSPLQDQYLKNQIY